MPSGELKINGVDAYKQWGISLSDGAKAILMTPLAMKERARNVSRLRNGVDIIDHTEKVESREITLPMHLTAPDSTTGLARYNSFCTDILYHGAVDIMIRVLPTVEYHCRYLSCGNFTELRNQIMKFSLKLEEPRPDSRTITSGREWQ